MGFSFRFILFVLFSRIISYFQCFVIVRKGKPKIQKKHKSKKIPQKILFLFFTFYVINILN